MEEREADSKEHDLLVAVGDLYTRYGIKSMTMDDVARHLGISKKTLYQYVDNKRDLVKKTMQIMVHEDQCALSLISEQTSGAIDELVEISRMVNEQMANMHPSVLYDMKKYYPGAWDVLRKHKEEYIFTNILSNLKRGIEEGLYRENLDPELVSQFYLAMVSNLMEEEDFVGKQYSLAEVHLEMMRYHIRGIASAKGRAYLKEKFSKENV